MKKKPFFIIGCVRSGTTLLRNILRQHPNLASPEETHFFRWSEPFGTEASMKPLANNQILKKHRGLDGITEAEFQGCLKKSISRSDLSKKYTFQQLLETNNLYKTLMERARTGEDISREIAEVSHHIEPRPPLPARGNSPRGQ